MNKRVLKILAIGSVLVFVACGKSDNQNVQPPAGYIPNCVGSGCTTVGGAAVATPFTGGDTESFTPVSTQVLGQYVGYPLNAPSSFQVNIALNPVGTSPKVFLGSLTIRFQDGQVLHNGSFSNGQSTTGYRSYQNTVSVLTTDSTGAPMYRIFFEDPAGAIVLTMSPSTGTDTSAPMTGKLYFLNFNSTAPNPLFSGAYDQYGTYFPPGIAFCWEIDLGPYDCQNFNVPPTSPMTNHQGDWTVPAFNYLGSIPVINPNLALGI